MLTQANKTLKPNVDTQFRNSVWCVKKVHQDVCLLKIFGLWEGELKGP